MGNGAHGRAAGDRYIKGEIKCGKCTKCVDICPVHAFTGRAFVEGEPRESRYDARACEKYFDKMEEEGIVSICGMCLFICPHGRKK
jgi:epoxyqueuosine reductase